jgi:hypothetical protein
MIGFAPGSAHRRVADTLGESAQPQGLAHERLPHSVPLLARRRPSAVNRTQRSDRRGPI